MKSRKIGFFATSFFVPKPAYINGPVSESCNRSTVTVLSVTVPSCFWFYVCLHSHWKEIHCGLIFCSYCNINSVFNNVLKASVQLNYRRLGWSGMLEWEIVMLQLSKGPFKKDNDNTWEWETVNLEWHMHVKLQNAHLQKPKNFHDPTPQKKWNLFLSINNNTGNWIKQDSGYKYNLVCCFKFFPLAL